MAIWAEKIDWQRRVRSVCKPCWELKYCPYGPVVEDFPLKPIPDEKSCRIFGHDCPVFYVAEPFTETRQLRNVSRTIPRPVQFRVLKRENQICRECGKPVADDDVHFDHIIPYSKGGSSDESNIRLVCGPCNLKKGARFEDRHLVKSQADHMNPPTDAKELQFLLFLADFARFFKGEEGRIPTAKDFAAELNRGKLTDYETHSAEFVADLYSVFDGKRPAEIPASLFRALKDRWGVANTNVSDLVTAASSHGVPLEELTNSDMSLVERLGFRVDLTSTQRERWQHVSTPIRP